MELNSVSCICFSPTGTTRAIVENIAKGLGVAEIAMNDFTQRSGRAGQELGITEDLVVIAAPVYYGRLPEEAVPFLKRLDGRNIPAVLVVVYGNREYDDALLELKDIAEERGFVPVAGGAFIGEHSYSLTSRPIAADRPDGQDREAARRFGVNIREKLKDTDALDTLAPLSVPGNFPYLVPERLHMLKEIRKQIPFTPETDTKLCIGCGICAEVCPTGAVDPEDVTRIDRWNCLICFACVKSCPEGAKDLTDPNFNQAIGELAQACQARKEPETFF